MKILLFEWLVGGGQWVGDGEASEQGPLLEQGKSMLLTLAGDLTRAGFELVLPVDARLKSKIDFSSLGLRVELVPIDSAIGLPEVLLAESQRCDGIVLIAPESDGCLTQCCRWLDSTSEKFISPDLGFVNLTADKQATCDWLAANGVRVPRGGRFCDFQISQHLNFPLVLKPILGAGSEGVQLICHRDQLPKSMKDASRFRIEEFVPGRSVSVSVLCGTTGSAVQHFVAERREPSGNDSVSRTGGLAPYRYDCSVLRANNASQCFHFLPATEQIFDAEPFGNYVETGWPISVELAERARRLAEQVVSALPATRGYIGIDMILSSESPEFDCVIEVNPRLTMSYSRLSQICEFNLGEKMVAVARGRA